MRWALVDHNDMPWNLDQGALRLGAGEVHVWLSSVSVASAQKSRLEENLSSDERARAARYRHGESRLEFILGRGLLRLLAAAYLGVDPRELRFTAGPHGKPTLAGAAGASGLEFNVSHSAGTVLHAFSWERCVGVDIEKIRPDSFTAAIARRFFSRREASWLSALPEEAQQRAFFSFWTRKEALLKARGEGLAGNLERVEIPLPAEGPEVVLTFPGESAPWSITDLDVGPDFAAALVAEGVGGEATLKRWVGEAPWPAGAGGAHLAALALTAGSLGGV